MREIRKLRKLRKLKELRMSMAYILISGLLAAFRKARQRSLCHWRKYQLRLGNAKTHVYFIAFSVCLSIPQSSVHDKSFFITTPF